MKQELYMLLDHNQALLQQYRSLSVMFQGFLIALAIAMISYASHQPPPYSYLLSIFVAFLVIMGLSIAKAMLRACVVRSTYVDVLQKFIYAIEAREISPDPDTPWLTILRYAYSKKNRISGYDQLYEIVDKTKEDSIKPDRGETRFTMTYLFHGAFFVVWGMLAAILLANS